MSPTQDHAEANAAREDAPKLRELGLHERYCLGRANCGFPPILSLAALVQSSAAGCIGSSERGALVDRLRSRIRLLVCHLALLSCVVEPGDTPRHSPRFRALAAGVGPEEVLHHRTCTSTQRGDPSSPSNLPAFDVDDVVWAGLRGDGGALDAAGHAPLWEVTVFAPPRLDVPSRASGGQGSQGETAGSRAIVRLRIHHLIADGRGAMSLLAALLADEAPSASELRGRPPGPAGTDAVSASPLLPPTSDVALAMRPPAWFVARELLADVATRLPARLRAIVSLPPPWPSSGFTPAPQTHAHAPTPTAARAPRFAAVRVSGGARIEALRAAGRRRGVPTVQGLVHAAALVALHATVHAEDKGRASNGTGTGTTATHVRSDTPISARSALKGHTRCTGNFVGSWSWRTRIDTHTPFWEMAREYASALSRPSTRAESLWTVGMLRYVAGKAVPPSSSPMEQTPPCETTPPAPSVLSGMEEWLLRRLSSAQPSYSGSIEVSNLGAVRFDRAASSPDARDARKDAELLREGEASAQLHVSDVGWAQMPGAIGSALTLDVCGLFGGAASTDVESLGTGRAGGGVTGRRVETLRVNVGWRDGVVDGQRFADALQVALAWMADETAQAERRADVATLDDVCEWIHRTT